MVAVGNYLDSPTIAVLFMLLRPLGLQQVDGPNWGIPEGESYVEGIAALKIVLQNSCRGAIPVGDTVVLRSRCCAIWIACLRVLRQLVASGQGFRAFSSVKMWRGASQQKHECVFGSK